MMSMNKLMITAGVVTLLQAVTQMILTGLGLAQYFCLIDFLKELPLVIYIRILYFHNPEYCGVRINIGHAIDGMINQAFVSLNQEPLTTFRTFVINFTSFGLSILWMIASVIIIIGGAKNKQSKGMRWPWITVTVAVCGVDLVATVIYANDSFHTRTLSDIMEYINGIASGTGGMDLDTSWASWVMVILYSRFVVFFFVNMFFIISVIIDGNAIRRIDVHAAVQVEAPTMADDATSNKDTETSSLPSRNTRIPRPGLSQSFRRMKELLFGKPSPPTARSNSETLNSSPLRSTHTQLGETDKKRTVNFPENLLSLPQRLENLIAEQQRRLDTAVIDTSGRRSPPRISQSMPQLNTASEQDSRGRGTAAELQGQLPWAYIPSSAHRMRDQLPPDEDLPPVPLPDYTAIQPFRKASVHRAASSLSSLIQKREALVQSRPTITQSDVLY
ncbi:uncharacterized protein LOC113521361 isoform X2 [Galleria mellonella]|uniref:Uncharacterized protein LOC113521361 isoform X2 n=1 Tax=Galleria mellonella TaxID=7137 RepID=A0A6J3C4S0_GALME|nr:uncharacterized protein LOC113521361 isoform X2 [Galleria mellonella]